MIPTLNDGDFLRYRFAPDVVSSLFGSVFWGALGTAVSFGGIVGAVVSLGSLAFFGGYDMCVFVFEFFICKSLNNNDDNNKTSTRTQVAAFFLKVTLLYNLIGTIAGFLATLLIKLIVLLSLRKLFFSGFYRNNPLASNLWFLFFEVWNVGLSLLFVIIRAIKIVIVSVFFLARVDTPLFAPRVGQVGPILLDSSWLAFRKDLLIHEAHRHPLVERFGLLCLLKLRYGSEFGTRAGSAWRLLYVLTLMPWLRKYRVSNGSMTDLEEQILAWKAQLVDESDEKVRMELEENIRSMQERLSLLQKSRPEIYSDEKMKEQENRELRSVVKKLKRKIKKLEAQTLTSSSTRTIGTTVGSSVTMNDSLLALDTDSVTEG